jgi:hypothetical protein
VIALRRSRQRRLLAGAAATPGASVAPMPGQPPRLLPRGVML